VKLSTVLSKDPEPLAEGLIKVPPEMLKELVTRVYSEYLSYMSTTKGGSFLEEAKKIASKYQAKIDPNFKPKNVATQIGGIDGIPDKVRKLWHYEFGKIDFIIDWDQEFWKDRPKVNASYDEKSGTFTINPQAFVNLLNADDYTDKKVEDLFDKVRYSMWHEASHAVQHNALKWIDKSQVAKSRLVRDNAESSASARRAEYLQSAVEFDPSLKTCIFKFKKIIEANPGNELAKLAVFVGGIHVDDKKPDEFFAAIKAQDLKKWKKAVKYFYEYYGYDPEKLIYNLEKP